MVLMDRPSRGRSERCTRHKSRMRWALAFTPVLLGLYLFSLHPAQAQTPTPTAIGSDWKVTIGQFDVSRYPDVTVYLNVTNARGEQVEGLQHGDFIVTEDGRLVALTGFAGVGEKRPVDIVYVFDITASMNEEIEGVVQTSLQFADELQRKGRDYRLGLVTFDDQVRQVQRTDNTLSVDAAEFKGWVSALTAGGGDMEPENDYAALHRALEMNFRKDAQIVFILITDAPAHRHGDPADSGVTFDDPKLDLEPTLKALKDKGVAVYAIAPDLDTFRKLAEGTGGRLYDIRSNPDFTGLVADIGRTLANQYRLTYRSPRPTYDGTRRNVQVRVGSASAGEVYAEQHLLTVRSNCLMGMLCLAPLLAALLALPAVRAGNRLLNRNAPSAEPAPSAVPGSQMDRKAYDISGANEAPAGPGSRDETIERRCPNCGQPLRREARFCNRCGSPV